jgi:hypothetical protein
MMFVFIMIMIVRRYTTSDKFYLEPHINPTEILVIDRITGEATVKGLEIQNSIIFDYIVIIF